MNFGQLFVGTAIVMVGLMFGGGFGTIIAVVGVVVAIIPS